VYHLNRSYERIRKKEGTKRERKKVDFDPPDPNLSPPHTCKDDLDLAHEGMTATRDRAL
jgi:hypothetical protein